MPVGPVAVTGPAGGSRGPAVSRPTPRHKKTALRPVRCGKREEEFMASQGFTSLPVRKLFREGQPKATV